MDSIRNEQNFFRNLKTGLKKTENKTREYFSASGADIYTRFVRRMFLALIAAGIVAGLTILLVIMIAGIASPRVKVSSVKGLDMVLASELLQEKGLNVEIQGTFDSNSVKYSVLDQYPKPGVTVRKGRTVTLLISKGRDVYTVPDLSGKNLGDAEQILRHLNISYEMTVIQSRDYPTNVVISQNIAPNTEVERAVPLKLVVNSDVSAGQFKVGDYVRQRLDVVLKPILSSGVRPVIMKSVTRNPDEDGVVISQNFNPGTIVPSDSDIQLFVGVYGEDDRETSMYNFGYFNYTLSSVDAAGDETASYDVRLVLQDERNEPTEIYANTTARMGELIVAPFKYYGKAVIRLVINNAIVKEVTYE